MTRSQALRTRSMTTADTNLFVLRVTSTIPWMRRRLRHLLTRGHHHHRQSRVREHRSTNMVILGFEWLLQYRLTGLWNPLILVTVVRRIERFQKLWRRIGILIIFKSFDVVWFGSNNGPNGVRRAVTAPLRTGVWELCALKILTCNFGMCEFQCITEQLKITSSVGVVSQYV